MLAKLKADKLNVKVYETRQMMGEASSGEMSVVLKRLLREKEEVNIIFAAAPSQNEFLETLVSLKEIEWNRVNAFHMDEYIGLDPKTPQSFGNFLKKRIFDRIVFKSVHLVNGVADNPEQECIRYAELLKNYPTDIVCMGIGENGHIAFNDPHVALFDDPEMVKIVDLDNRCRIQQVNDGCFPTLHDVPTHAITLTIPTILSGRYLFCMVPGKTKKEATTRTIQGKIDPSCPSTILKTHDNAVLYLDIDSAAKVI